ncbi:MAG: LuxR C-terminal-related transcriptional regulator [Planctomycetota bacterium]
MTAPLVSVSLREPRIRPVPHLEERHLEAFRVAYEHRRDRPDAMLTRALDAWFGPHGAGVIEWRSDDQEEPLASARTGRSCHEGEYGEEVVVTMSASDRLSAYCTREGSPSFASLVRFLAALVRDEHVIPRDHRRSLLDRLSPMQQRITPLLVKGMSEREIGRELSRSHHTIHEHVKSIYQALRVRSRIDLRDVWLARAPDEPSD